MFKIKCVYTHIYISWIFVVKIEALPEVVEAVQGKLEVYLDGGIREGTDVFKALALGAKMVNILYNIYPYVYLHISTIVQINL